MVKYLKFLSLLILAVSIFLDIYASIRYSKIQSFIGLSYADCVSILGHPNNGVLTDSPNGGPYVGYDFENGHALGFDRNMVCITSFSNEIDFGIISKFLYPNFSDLDYYNVGKWHGFKQK